MNINLLPWREQQQRRQRRRFYLLTLLLILITITSSLLEQYRIHHKIARQQHYREQLLSTAANSVTHANVLKLKKQYARYRSVVLFMRRQLKPQQQLPALLTTLKRLKLHHYHLTSLRWTAAQTDLKGIAKHANTVTQLLQQLTAVTTLTMKAISSQTDGFHFWLTTNKQ